MEGQQVVSVAKHTDEYARVEHLLQVRACGCLGPLPAPRAALTQRPNPLLPSHPLS